ncbi:BppU family phage baseplate upper protein [Clostridium perfringens]|uniref:BppU family phage baseplate upper protein n=1 Tax=Clostridium perfringens TaxID=1502 RepID=UPI0039EC9247
MQYIQTKTVYIDRDELIEIKAIEHDVKTRFIDFKFIAANKILDISHCIVRVYALNSKGNEIFNNLTVTDGAKGIARLELTDSLLVPGTIEYMLKITTDNGGILSSNRFNLIVDKDLMTGNAIEGTNEYKALDEALKTVGELNSMKVNIEKNATNIDNTKKELNKKVDDNINELNKSIRNLDCVVKENKSNITALNNLYNIIPNSTFIVGKKGWLCDVEFWSGAYSGYGFKGKNCGAFKNTKFYDGSKNEVYLQSYKAFKVEKNTDYTISFHYAVEKNIYSMDAFIVLSNKENGDYTKQICILTAQGGSQTDLENDTRFDYTFNTGSFEYVWIRFDNNGMKNSVNVDEYCWLYISEVSIYKGNVRNTKWMPKLGENYSKTINTDEIQIVFGDGEGTYSSSNGGDLEYTTGGVTNKYPVLKYIASFSIPAGNPGTVNVKLPKEFTKRKETLTWGVVPKGYYYNTSGNFFPFHVAVNGKGEAYEQDGYMYCPVEGYCRIQNGENSGDVQPQSINAVVIALA